MGPGCHAIEWEDAPPLTGRFLWCRHNATAEQCQPVLPPAPPPSPSPPRPPGPSPPPFPMCVARALPTCARPWPQAPSCTRSRVAARTFGGNGLGTALRRAGSHACGFPPCAGHDHRCRLCRRQPAGTSRYRARASSSRRPTARCRPEPSRSRSRASAHFHAHAYPRPVTDVIYTPGVDNFFLKCAPLRRRSRAHS